MAEPVYNAASGLPSDPQTPLFSFSGEMMLLQQHLQAAAASGASTSFVPHQHQQVALIPQSMSSVPQQHPQAATVSDVMAIFNNLDRNAKMSRMYEFMFAHMRGLETRLNEVAKNTSERFSQVDAKLQALEQRAGEKIVRPHESTAEIVVSGLRTRDQFSYEDIVTRIFNFIGATKFLLDVISIRKLNSTKENESSSTPNGDSAVHTSFTHIPVQICTGPQ